MDSFLDNWSKTRNVGFVRFILWNGLFLGIIRGIIGTTAIIAINQLWFEIPYDFLDNFAERTIYIVLWLSSVNLIMEFVTWHTNEIRFLRKTIATNRLKIR